MFFKQEEKFTKALIDFHYILPNNLYNLQLYELENGNILVMGNISNTTSQTLLLLISPIKKNIITSLELSGNYTFIAAFNDGNFLLRSYNTHSTFLILDSNSLA